MRSGTVVLHYYIGYAQWNCSVTLLHRICAVEL